MRLIKEQIDRWAIRAAAKSLPRVPADPGQRSAVEAWLSRTDLFVPPEKAPLVKLGQDQSFQFSSSVQTPFPPNNVVHGKLFPAPGEWKERPSVVLVHGWNAEMHYIHFLPTVARGLSARGINGMLLELPYHLHRRPAKGHAVTNFISENIPRMLEATTQAVADLNAALRWLKAEGSPATALWGFSLGAWLVGLHACVSASQDAAVLATPVSNLERAVRELEFCHPIRAALGCVPCDLRQLNLSSRVPQIPPEQILLVEALYDRFVPSETYSELASAWQVRDWQRVPQSHISILVSRAAVQQCIEWLEGRLC